MKLRTCSSCGIEKELHKYFYKQVQSRSHRADGYLKQCKSCVLEKNRIAHAKPKNKQKVWENKIQYRYGITKEDYHYLLEKQKGCCAICGTDNPSSKSKKHNYFSIDHCHFTGKIRGLLCATCNSAIGLLGDCPQTIEKASMYLRSTQDALNKPSGFKSLPH
jgi:Recombination endonuclease VII